MLFNSWQYVVFLPLVVLGHFLLPHRARWAWLLAASYYFYMSWNARLVVLIATTTLVSWGTALLMDHAGSRGKKRGWLALGAVVSLGILFFFKYFDFFTTSLAAVMGRFGLPHTPLVLGLVLPVGISFYTFQTLGYVIDVYRGDMRAERHLGIYALFVSFFPQLVAGPIERATNLLPQFRQVHTPNPAGMAWGLRMVCWGLFKKAVVADRLAIYVNAAYNDMDKYTPMTWLLATVLFSAQIFCDFSGYSDIARGSAAMMGFELMENFKAPYLSKSIREFWRRWHVSLSSWFMDYVYIPLGGSRVGRVRHLLNLFLTFLLSGLWHGARWNFVIWGCYHGALMVIDALLRPLWKRWNTEGWGPWARGLVAAAKVLGTYVLVCLGWVFFRAASLGQIRQVLAGIPAAFASPLAGLAEAVTSLGIGVPMLAFFALAAGALLLFDAFVYRARDPFTLLAQKKAPARVFISYALALVVLAGVLSMPEGVAVEFIYFQF